MTSIRKCCIILQFKYVQKHNNSHNGPCPGIVWKILEILLPFLVKYGMLFSVVRRPRSRRPVQRHLSSGSSSRTAAPSFRQAGRVFCRSVSKIGKTAPGPGAVFCHTLWYSS